MNAPTPSRSLSERLWIFFSEAVKLLAIAVGCLVVFALAFFVWAKTGLIKYHIPARWVGLFYWTCALLWVILRQFKGDLRKGRFWGALLAFLALHVGAFVLVLRSYPQWRQAWFIFIFLIEGTLVIAALRSVVQTRHHR